MRIGVNLFGLNELASRDFMSTAKKLAAYGFGSFEPLVMFACDRKTMEGKPFVPTSIWQQDELIERSCFLKENYGVEITTCHIGGLPGEDFSGKTDCMIEMIQRSGLRDFVVSRMLRTDEECKRDAEIFNKTAEKLAPYGGRVLYHNHESEQKTVLIDGRPQMILDRILSLCDDSVKLEIDVGWVLFSGVDPVPFLPKYQDRLERLHLKDFRPDFSLERRERDIVAVGSGVLPLRELLREALAMGLRDDRIIIDQDCSEQDLLQDLHDGINVVNAMIGELGR